MKMKKFESCVSLSEQLRKFAEILLTRGEVIVTEIAKELGVSRQTVYNNLRELQSLTIRRDKGKIYLSHVNHGVNSIWMNKNWEFNVKMAEHIVQNILRKYTSIFLDSGAEAVSIIDEIMEREMVGLSIITTNSYLAEKLCGYESLRELHVIGGTADFKNGSFWGPWTGRLLDDIRGGHLFTQAFISADAVELKGNTVIVRTARDLEIGQKRKIMEMAYQVFIIVANANNCGSAIINEPIGSKALDKVHFIIGSKAGGDKYAQEVKQALGAKATLINY